MTVHKTSNRVDPIDFQIGGDDDGGAFAATITADDIAAIMQSAQPLRERRQALTEMWNALQARSHADRGGDSAGLLAEVDAALAQLKQGAGEVPHADQTSPNRHG